MIFSPLPYHRQAAVDKVGSLLVCHTFCEKTDSNFTFAFQKANALAFFKAKALAFLKTKTLAFLKS